MTGLVVIKCCFMWPTNSSDVFSASVCVLDTAVLEGRMDDKNKHDIFCTGLGNQPPNVCDLFQLHFL